MIVNKECLYDKPNENDGFKKSEEEKVIIEKCQKRRKANNIREKIVTVVKSGQ